MPWHPQIATFLNDAPPQLRATRRANNVTPLASPR